MMLAFGSFVVRAKRYGYNPELPPSELEKLDEKFDQADEVLWSELETWLRNCGEHWLKWQFERRNNNHTGLLQLNTSRNHRSSQVWELLEYLSKSSTGTYGILYVNDDEDIEGLTCYGRGKANYQNVFRVWSLKNGELIEHSDPFLSPILEAGEDA
jgi:hypothetical protein